VIKTEYEECENCKGWCCAVYNGVQIRDGEAERISEHLGIGVEEFITKYTHRLIGDELLLRSRPCPFWTNNRCDIHDVKPGVCANFDPSHVPLRYKLPDYKCEGIMAAYYDSLK